MESKVNVYRLNFLTLGELKPIDNTLKSFQEQVGGHIEVVSLDAKGELDLFVNEEGKLIAFPINRCWLDEERKIIELICGNAFVARHDEKGNTISILEDDIPYIEKVLRPVLGYSDGVVDYLTEDDDVMKAEIK